MLRNSPMLPIIVELDGKIITALASSTRRGILKKLMVAPQTLSELSRDLDINKSAISRHLGVLGESGLISRRVNGKEYVYYEITVKGKNILGRNENIKLIIVLSSLITAVNLGIIALYEYYRQFQANIGHPNTTFGHPAEPVNYWDFLPSSTQDMALLIIGVALILGTIAVIGHYILKNKRKGQIHH